MILTFGGVFMKLKNILLVAAICFLLIGCGKKANDLAVENIEQSDKITPTSIALTESWDFASGFYPIISPANSNNHGITYWSRNFYNTLVSYNDNFEIQGELAKDYEISDDGLTYTFYLREGIKFSDGTPLTADSVKQSFLAAITNLGMFNGSYGKITTLIKNMEAKDENTFVMTLINPYYGTLNDLTMINPMSIINPKAFEGGEDKAQENSKNETMGTGAYMYDSFDGTTYTFVRNPNYWGEKPDLDSFQIKVIEDNAAKFLALRNGEIDAIVGSNRIDYDAFEDISSDNAYTASINKNGTKGRYIGFNLSQEPFDDILVRQAMAYAIDQQSLEKSVFNGVETAAETMFPYNRSYCNVEQKIYNTNIEKANALMDKAGWVDTDNDGIREKDGKKLEISFNYTKSLSSVDNAALTIGSQLAKIGFKINSSGEEMMSWYSDIMANNYSMVLWYTYGGANDPGALITNINENTNADPIVKQYSNFLDGKSTLIDELNSTADLNRVQEIYTYILQTISEQSLMIPVTYIHEAAIWNNNKISDYHYYPDADYVNISGIHLK